MPRADPSLALVHTAAYLTSQQRESIRRLRGRVGEVAAHTTIFREGTATSMAYAVVEGWAFTYRSTPDGDRQVLDFVVPGDVVGLGDLYTGEAAQSCESITVAELVEIPLVTVKHAARVSPELMEALVALVSRERDKLAEHLLDVGRRDSEARIAHLLLELGHRLQLVGRASPGGYACPVSQYLLADALGLTAVHVNRVLRRLRLAGLLTFRSGHVTFHDMDRLVEMAGFDPGHVAGAPPPASPLRSGH